MKVHELPPNAGRMINSLRDAGYDFNTAVADIVDNSIAAGATLIDIRAQCSQRDGEITVSIGDNGCGMTLDQLCNVIILRREHRPFRGFSNGAHATCVSRGSRRAYRSGVRTSRPGACGR